jgi:hypothetical protein
VDDVRVFEGVGARGGVGAASAGGFRLGFGAAGEGGWVRVCGGGAGCAG